MGDVDWANQDNLEFRIGEVDPEQAAGADGKTVTLRQHSIPGQVLGTVGYMSPEQVRATCRTRAANSFGWRNPLRDARPANGLLQIDLCRDDDGDPERRSASGVAGCSQRSAGVAEDCDAMPGEEPGAAHSTCNRPRIRIGITLRFRQHHSSTFDWPKRLQTSKRTLWVSLGSS